MRLTLGFFFLFEGAMIFAIPNMTRGRILFSVPVPEGFRESGAGRQSIAVFRALVTAAVIAELAALFLCPERFLAPLGTAGPLLI